MIASVVSLFTVLSLLDVNALPVSQPAYGNNQYYAAPQQYLQQIQNQPQYISVPPIPQAPTPIYEGAPQHQVSQQFIPSPPTQRVSQLLLPSAADRQVQKAAEQIAGPDYAQQVLQAQQQGIANEAIVTAQRRAQAQLTRAQLQAQQARQAQHPQQVQYQQAQQQQQYVEIAQVAPRQQYVQVPQHAQPQQYQLQYEQEYQPQPAKSYRPAPQPSRSQLIKQQQQQQQQQEQQQEEEHDNNASYQFGFDVKDDLYTNYQNRKEQREGGKISGSYSVVDSDGFIRTVTYTADPKEGFKAEVVRQPTDIVVKIPKPKQQAQEPQQQYIQEVPVQRYQSEGHQQHQHQKQNIVYQYQ